jgi:MarR family transcriptional repressor of emrRAB
MSTRRDARTANLLGALALTLTDAMAEAVEHASDRGSSGPAALVLIHDEPGLSNEDLRRGLGLSQPATARLVDALVDARLVKQGPGPDGRTHALGLTSSGLRRVRRLLQARAAVLDDALVPLSTADRRALTTILEQILSRSVRDEAHAESICRLCDTTACPPEVCPVEQGQAG